MSAGRVLETRAAASGVVCHVDGSLLGEHRVLVAFTERGGGVSRGRYSSLNLAGHVGDDPARVDENRTRLLSALGLDPLRARLTLAEQVHGTHIAEVGEPEAGAGAYSAGGRPPVAATDALLTTSPQVPLLLCFADCVPVVLVAAAPVRAVAVVHAGWRGALARLPGLAAEALAARVGCDTSDLVAYIGPHICAKHYPVGPERLSQFANAFATIPSARDRLDLGAVVSRSLIDAGVPSERRRALGLCTAEHTDRFYSYRAEGVTGRHGAFAVVL